MKAVLDCSVAMKGVLPEEYSDKAARLRDDYILGAHELIAPDVFPVECAHAISRSTRRGILKEDEATLAMTEILQTLPTLHDSLILLPRAFEISLNARIGIYDCLYLALSEREGVPLITADQRLISLAGFQVLDVGSL